MQLPALVVATRDVAIRALGGTPPPDSRALGGAGTPPKPVEPQGTDPRAAVLPWQYNTVARPRSGSGIVLPAFDQLRSLAEFDLIAIARKDVRDQILGMEWTVRVKPQFVAEDQRFAKTIDQVRAFIESPDPLAGIEWCDWLGSVADEIMITDALTILPRRNLAGALIGLEQIDGATIVPLVDDRGRPPMRPQPAYQQIVRGMPETEFFFGDILYLPRNRRADSPYGRSNVEHVMFTANLALRQAMHELGFYTNGNIPDGGFWSLPEGSTPDQVRDFREQFNAVLDGRVDRRAGRLEIMPPGKYTATKDRQWSYEFLEWLARVISWSFGVSPIPIAKQMNRSTGDTMESSAMEAGPRPIAAYIASVVNRCLRQYGGITEVEFAWADDETEDATVVIDRHVRYVGAGIMGRNEAREQAGLDAFDFYTPPTVDTPAGPVLLDTVLNPIAPSTETPPNTPPDAAASSAEQTPNTGPEKAGDEQPTAQDKAWHAAFTKYRAEVASDLRKWKDVWVKRAKDGKGLRLFKSSVIPNHIRAQVASVELTTEPGKPQTATLSLSFAPVLELFKAELPVTGKRRKIERAIEAVVNGWLSALEPKVVSWAVGKLPGSAVKADGPDYDAGSMADDLVKSIEAGVALGALEASKAIGINLETVPANVITYARKRAGELVGKTLVGDVWVDSTSGYAISDTLRTKVHDLVTKAIEESWTPQQLTQSLKAEFEPWRAETIARTETGFAYGNGAAEVYSDAGVEMLTVLDGDGCLPFGHQDGAPKAAGDLGVVEASAEAQGQRWTVGQYQASILGHPNCLIGSEIVVAPNTTAAFTRWFDGEVVVLRTASDDLLTCTPNHPVLTDRGWLAAGSLREGDNVIRCLDSQRIALLIDPDHEHVPAMIEEVVGSLLEASRVPSRVMPASPENFHGDGAGGDVHVVDVDGFAGLDVESARDEHFAKRDLGRGSVTSERLDALGAATLLCDRLLSPPDGVVSGLGSSTALLGSSLRSAECLSLAGRPQSPASATESLAERCAVASDAHADRVGVLSCDVALIERAEVENGTIGGKPGFAATSHGETQPMKPLAKSFVGMADDRGDLRHALAALVEPVRVVDVCVRKFSGHVFNLETRQGWYVASGIVTHNCVRVAVPYTAE